MPWLRRFTTGVMLLGCLLSVAACPDETPTRPGQLVGGTVRGEVMALERPLAGVTGTLTGQTPDGPLMRTTTTDATGAYVFAGVASTGGKFDVRISGYPNDVTFDAVVQAVQLSEEGDTEIHDFNGRRQFEGQLTVVSDRSGNPHDPHVFSAGSGKTVRFEARVNNNTLIVSGLSGFGPSAMPTLTGAIGGDRSFLLSGSGPIASTTAGVTATGTVVGTTLTMTIIVGGNGELPGAVPITYSFVTQVN